MSTGWSDRCQSSTVCTLAVNLNGAILTKCTFELELCGCRLGKSGNSMGESDVASVVSELSTT